MRVLDAARSREADRTTIASGVEGLTLMERASEAVAREAVRAIGARPGRGERVVVLCGTGNNGGDGFGAALHLSRSPAVGSVEVLLLGREEAVSGDPRALLQRIHGAGIPVRPVARPADLEPIRRATLVVDALFGTGLARPLEAGSLPAEAVRLGSSGRAFAVAVDVPSGLDASRAEPIGPHFVADLTVTFGFPKTVHLRLPAAGACGRVVVADIGLLPVSEEGLGDAPEAVTARDVAPIFPRRPAAAHKGSYGTVLVCGGAEGMAGAAALAARASLRAGAGKAAVAASAASRPTIHALSVESTTADGPSLAGFAAVVAGPGLGTSEAARTVFEWALAAPLPAVFDADALNLAAGAPERYGKRPAPTVLTPHPGEAARLLGIGTREVAADREGIARHLASRSGAVVVLKGFRSVVAEPGGRVAHVLSGNPGMASGGMGDVLSGIVGALLARGLSPWDSACAGAYLHGLAGDLARERLGEESLVASDVVDALPFAFEAIREALLP